MAEYLQKQMQQSKFDFDDDSFNQLIQDFQRKERSKEVSIVFKGKQITVLAVVEDGDKVSSKELVDNIIKKLKQDPDFKHDSAKFLKSFFFILDKDFNLLKYDS